jgi:hypothetical protein
MAKREVHNDERGTEVSISQVNGAVKNVLDHRSSEGRSPSELDRVEEWELRIDNE